MKGKLGLFKESLRLVWQSAPGWATVNILVAVLQSILPLALIYLIKLLIDAISKSSGSAAGYGMNYILWMILAVVAIYLLGEFASDLGTYIKRKQSVKLEIFMHNLLHAKAIRLDLINFEHPEYFDCLSRAVSEAPWRPNSILNNIISMFRGILSLLLMAGLLLALHWSIVVLLLVVNVPGIWLRLHYADVLYNFQRTMTPEARKSAYFNWLLTGDRPSRELRLFGLGNYFIDLFRKSFFRQKDEELEIIRKRTLIELVSDVVKALAMLVILIYIAQRTVNGSLTLGQMAMFLLAFRQGMTYIKDFFSSIAALYEDGLFIGDTFEFLNLKEMMEARQPEVTPPQDMESIKVRQLSFTYPGNVLPALDRISFEINKGEIIALVGPNGAGKSTLVKILTRLYDPDSGVVEYNGMDIRNMDPELYRKNFSVIFQDFMLYNLNAGENIRMGDINAAGSAVKIQAAARAAGVHELIKDLPDGYETMIGNLFDESRELSWGEWQKIALARALFRESQVLVLDEPSSALDAETEYEIFSRFREIIKDRTAILITHRLSNISLADRIVVLDNGRIAETGTHRDLVAKRGLYYSMYTKQTRQTGSE